MQINHIIFYGTLQQHDDTIIHEDIGVKLRYIEDCSFSGRLYDMGRYPALKHGEGTVHGELYEILDHSILDTLDEYEAKDNEDPHLPGFIRELAEGIDTWVYYYDGDVGEDTFIKSGVWRFGSS